MPRVIATVIAAEMNDDPEVGGVIVKLHCPTGGRAFGAHLESELEFELPESPAAKVFEVRHPDDDGGE